MSAERPGLGVGGTDAGRSPLGIVAGGGRLPLEVADAVTAAGRRVILFRIAGEADLPAGPHDSHTLGWGQIGRFFDLLAASGVEEVAFAGTIGRRPSFSSLVPDLGTIRRLPGIVRGLSGGDDTVIRKMLALFEAEGYRVAPLGEVAPALLAGAGVHGRHAPSKADRADVSLGQAFLDRMAPFDVGQAVVVVDGRVVAVEAAEGTDRMLARCADLRRGRRFRARGRRGVLVKLPKTVQDRRTDLPVVGLRTVERAIEAGLAGIAVAAGGTILVERAATIAAADRKGLFVEGIA